MNDLLTYLNIAVVIIFAVAYIPQILTTFKANKSDGVSPMFWFLVGFSTLISLFNLLETGEAPWYVYMGQFINTTIAVCFALWFNYLENKKSGLILYLCPLLYVILIYSLIFHNIVYLSQIFASIWIVLAYMFQIKHFIKAKTSAGVNPLLFLLFAIGITLLTIIMYLTNASLHIIITEIINVVLLLTCFILTIYYNKQNNL
ncbi:PQ-loop domain-containing transporter [Staphylococcus chromogenes]|uniref:PQ-loop domain-containing transporter n=1 Tax=Staphylococcus chromogenes TaxID=46126 RepID=UPI002887F89A|nr:PQ-loop domain-containing transporter [Staphylococcus chromogenes]MDT0700330.1 PQ-loop domain-containing transporter [Staphylococcus chromogenes]